MIIYRTLAPVLMGLFFKQIKKMNKAILTGNLGKDPEVKTFADGSKVANVSIATSESFKDKQGNRQTKTEWHNLVAWSPIADIWEKHCKKGSSIEIVGSIQTRSYETDNGLRYTTEILVREFGFIGSKQQQPGDISPERESNEAEVDDLPF